MSSQLIMKASIGDWKAVDELLKSGADWEAADDQGLNVLMHASYFGHIRVVKGFLAHLSETQCKASVYQTTPDGYT